MSPEGRQVFITGATGFIGGRLARALLSRGYRVRCLVRRPAAAAELAAQGAELIAGDLTDEEALARGAAGAWLAYHLAAVYAIGRVDVAAMERANVEGTRRFLTAVEAARVERVVHVSSTVALRTVDEGGELVESAGPFPSEYHRTKAAAHGLARRAQQRGQPVVIACPGAVYGPGDEGPTMLFMSDLLRHRVPGLSTRPTRMTYAHVDDIVDGLVAAGERGAIGATYVLGGEIASTTEYAVRIGRLAGVRVSPLRFPPPLVRLTGTLMDGISRLTGARLPISRELADLAGAGRREDHPHDRATRDLGYAPRSLEEGLPETIRDVRERMKR